MKFLTQIDVKRFLLNLALVMSVVLSIRYFFPGKSEHVDAAESASVQSFVAPTKGGLQYKPIDTEIDFSDQTSAEAVTKTRVETSWGIIDFSTEGAAFDALSVRRFVDGVERVYPVFDFSLQGRESKGLLLACDEQTPYFYKLVSQQDRGSTVELVYRATGQMGTLTKTFNVYKDEHKVDLHINLEPGIKPTALRVFFPAPMPPVENNTYSLTDPVSNVAAVVIDNKNDFEKIAYAKLNGQQGWLRPALFGTDDRYFVHAMVGDADNFAQRAYFRFDGKIGVSAVLESAEVQENHSWRLSFYFGPKETSSMVQVDPRLEKVFDQWAIFSLLSKFFLAILNFLYTYLHSYGLAIIVLTAILKLLLLPFTYRSEADMKLRMEMQKKIAYLEAKHKNDSQTLTREKAELIKKYGMPGLGSCLPMLLQGVVFFALSKVISGSYELYKAPMAWIPDLSSRDPYYILPLMVAVALVMHALVQSDTKQRVSGLIVALIFGVFAANMSAGIALYLSVNVLLGVVQSWLVKRFKLAS
jgi:YidC/Oxa1 family membrane protein insertase